MALAYICLPEKYDELMKYYEKRRSGNPNWIKAKRRFESSSFQLNLLRQDFEKNKIMDFSTFDKTINYEFKKKIGKVKK